MRKIRLRKIYFLPFSFLLFLACKVQAQNVDAQKATSLIQKNISFSGLTPADLQNSRISAAYVDKLSGATLVYLQQTYQGVDVDKHISVFAFKNSALVSALGRRYPIGLIGAIKTAAPKPIPSISARDAVQAAAGKLNISLSSLNSPISAKQSAARETNFGNVGKVSNISARLVWVTDENASKIKTTFKKVTLCWIVNLMPDDSVNAWRVKVDASNGHVIGKENYTVSETLNKKTSTKQLNTGNGYADKLNENNFGAGTGSAGINSASYRVVKFPAEAPSFPGGTPSIHTNPWELASAGNDATTLKWNYDGTNAYDSTRGNNVYAELNWYKPELGPGNQGPNIPLGSGAAHSSSPVPDLNFNFVPNFANGATDSANRNFAVTNLFYWNNIMHDLSYQYGFDEVSGNFQQNNLNRGGIDGDYVVAFAQDGKGQTIGYNSGDTISYLNNANFATPPDGQSPRMRMYLFSHNPVTINSPASVAGEKLSVEGQLSYNNTLDKVGPITANVILYNDDTSSTTHIGCVPPSNNNQLKGKIALIDRGSCAFTVKIKNAQDAGANGVIVADNKAGESPFPMSGPDNTITIPAAMITFETGKSIKTILNTGIVNATLKANYLDGDLDAGVMCHEYTHGISNRLTGGPAGDASCLFNGEQMGEGWSDYDALMFTTDWSKAQITDGIKKRPLGTYVDGEPNNGPGIRTYPYSTDTAIDKWTYALMNETGGEVHTTGEIWCSALWDMTWNIIQEDGINKNIYNAGGAGGNSVALKLVYEGMKLQTCSPGFIDGRDAILKADTLLYGGKYSCAIWKAFTRRGMGILASEGSAELVGDEIPSFDDGILKVTKHVDKDSASQGELLTYTLGVKAAPGCGSAIVTGTVADFLPQNVTYVTGSGGVYNSIYNAVVFSNVSVNGNDSATYKFKATVNKGSYFKPDTLFKDAPGNKVSNIWTSAPNGYKWTSVDLNEGSTPPLPPDYWYYSGDSSEKSENFLTTKNTYLVPGAQTILSFNSIVYNSGGLNGGVVEISSDNGATWQDLGGYIIDGLSYTLLIDASSDSPIKGRGAFSGTDIDKPTKIDLSSFAGNKVKIRFRYASASGSGTDPGLSGWYIQKISLSASPAAYNVAETVNAAGQFNSISHVSTGIKNAVLPVTWESFTATKQKNNALLEWTTAQEINSASFDVERSSNGINFTKLGSQQAVGNSTIKQDYSFVDETPLQGLNIYRIKQIDRDGKFAYSVYRPLTFDNAPSFNVTPNPAKDKVKVTVTGNTKLLHVYLMSSSGQQLNSFEMNGETKDLNLPTLASGVYHIMVKGDGVSYKKKIVIQ